MEEEKTKKFRFKNLKSKQDDLPKENEINQYVSESDSVKAAKTK